MIEEYIDLDLKKKYEDLVNTDSILPIKISPFYFEKVKEEINKIGIGGPLYRSVLPTQDKINLKTSFETRDYVEEEKHQPVAGANYIIRKYEDRLVFIVSDVCFAHCQYCFRTYNLSKFQKSNLKETIERKVETLKTYLKNHREIKEVILSGGDPLSIGYDNLLYVLEELKEWYIRIHTRAIIYSPEIFDFATIKLLSKHNVRLVFHINHPYEICEIVESRIKELYTNNVRLYAQFPLLRGINDHYVVLKTLLEKMDELHIRPISIFIPDPISYGTPFRIEFDRVIDIMNKLNWNTNSWINSVRFCMDTTIGKVRYDNIIKREGKCITFSREGKEVNYYDLDDGIDKPTPLNQLLWKKIELIKYLD